MQWYSLVTVTKRSGAFLPKNKVEGSWIQNHFGTLESARKSADDTNEVNSNKLDIEVCWPNASVTPILNGPEQYKIADH